MRVGGPRSFLDSQEYSELRDVTLELLGRRPLAKNYFIGLGRDPAPIIAFLQNLGDEIAMTFPASGKGRLYDDTPELRAYFDDYCRRLIPRSVIEGDRDIVLVDQTRAGREREVNGSPGTLALVRPIMEGSLRRLGFKGKVIRAAFSSAEQMPEVEHIDITSYREVQQFAWEHEDQVSEYPWHAPGFESLDAWLASRRPQYDQYKDALRLRMTADPDLDRKLEAMGAFGEPVLKRVEGAGDRP